MQRSRCYAANVYDASAALQATFCPSSGRQPLIGINTSATERTRPYISVTRRTEYAANQRLYTNPTTARERYSQTIAGDAEASNRRSHKLAFYEAASDIAQSEIGKDSRHARNRENDQVRKKPSAQDWRNHMFAISTFVREQRLSNTRTASDGPRIKLQDTKNAYNIESVDDLDYEGFYIKLAEDAESPGRIPWMRGRQSRLMEEQKSNAKRVLDHEILAFGKFMSLSSHERNARHAVRILVNKIIASLPEFKSTRIYCYGSYRTGLAMPCSDIDFGLSNDDKPPDPSSMAALHHTLCRGSDFMCVVYRPENGIITAQHSSTGIDVQILAKGRRGRQDDKVAKFIDKIPNIRELYMVVRTALGVRGLVDPYVGGISAYGTFMIVAASLTGRRRNLNNSPAIQLLHFLDFWADFDTTKHGIGFSSNGAASIFDKIPASDSTTEEDAIISDTPASIDPPQPQSSAESPKRTMTQYRIGCTRPGQPYLLSLEDPAWATNDLGSRCHAIKHILQTLKVLREDLLSSMAQYDEAVKAGRNDEAVPSFLLPLVGGSHKTLAERKEQRADAKILSIIKNEFPREREARQRFRATTSSSNVHSDGVAEA